jgi:hypothetical protein
MRHTPGPWGNCGGIIYAESDGFAVAKIANEHPDQAIANMRLIKAAPDLLEALERIEQEFINDPAHGALACRMYKIAREAIKKARGDK